VEGEDGPVDGAPVSRRSGRTGRWILLGAAIGLVGVLAIGAWRRSDGGTTADGDHTTTTVDARTTTTRDRGGAGSSDPTASTAAGATTTDVGQSTTTTTPATPEQTVARRTLTDLLAATVGVVNGTDPSTPLTDIAAGAVRGELEAARQEYDANGWRQEGAASVASVTVVTADLAAADPTVTVDACIDSSAVRVLDRNGTDLRNQATPDRSLNRYVLVRSAGVWRVTGHTFPADATC
jgi:hypothetical protein